MHPRNRARDGYDLRALVATSPELGGFVVRAPHGGETIDFADPAAVTALNRALLRNHYGVRDWSLPAGYLCPPVPGRADYIHHVADLLTNGSGVIPRGESIAVLDVGVGANCIYPLIGHGEYGWSFVGCDIDATALANAAAIVKRNGLGDSITLRRQESPTSIFRGVIRPTDQFAVTMCNPPFHASVDAAMAGTKRKVRNLTGKSTRAVTRNFGGAAQELWCAGGELAFIRRMITESIGFSAHVGWFTTLVSKSAHVPLLRDALTRAKATDVRTIAMAQGQKQSRLLAWRFGPAR